MKTDPERHHRRSIRLKSYDYARAGAYFITLCVQDRACLFGNVVGGGVRLHDAGRMVQTVWDELPVHYLGVDIDAFAVMPNHIHGIIVLDGVDRVGAGPRACPRSACQDEGQPRGVAPTPLSLPDVMHRFKTMTTKRYADGVKQSAWPTFHDRL
jgi:putative transposase